jgi:hypothetical protein
MPKSTRMARLRSRPSLLGYRLGARVQAGRAPRDRLGRRHLVALPSAIDQARRHTVASRVVTAVCRGSRHRTRPWRIRASGTAKVGTITSGYVEMRRFVLAELSRSRLFGSPASFTANNRAFGVSYGRRGPLGDPRHVARETVPSGATNHQREKRSVNSASVR